MPSRVVRSSSTARSVQYAPDAPGEVGSMTGAIDRFTEAARAEGIEPQVRRFPEGTKTAADAARAIGCALAQIVKSLVFMADGVPLIALTSGAQPVDPTRVGGGGR